LRNGPAIWLDEHAARPTHAFQVGREAAVVRLRYEHLRANGWKPVKTLAEHGANPPRAGRGRPNDITDTNRIQLRDPPKMIEIERNIQKKLFGFDSLVLNR